MDAEVFDARLAQLTPDGFAVAGEDPDEPPCWLIGVTEGGPDAWTVYALGSTYTGDGTRVDEYKTHLYFIPAPR